MLTESSVAILSPNVEHVKIGCLLEHMIMLKSCKHMVICGLQYGLLGSSGETVPGPSHVKSVDEMSMIESCTRVGAGNVALQHGLPGCFAKETRLILNAWPRDMFEGDPGRSDSNGRRRVLSAWTKAGGCSPGRGINRAREHLRLY